MGIRDRAAVLKKIQPRIPNPVRRRVLTVRLSLVGSEDVDELMRSVRIGSLANSLGIGPGIVEALRSEGFVSAFEFWDTDQSKPIVPHTPSIGPARRRTIESWATRSRIWAEKTVIRNAEQRGSLNDALRRLDDPPLLGDLIKPPIGEKPNS